MKKLGIALVILATLIIIIQLYILDYDHLVSAQNTSNYLGIIAMVCVILSIILGKTKKN